MKEVLKRWVVKETCEPQPGSLHQEPYVDWLTFESRSEADDYVTSPLGPRAGFGQRWVRVIHEIFEATLTPVPGGSRPELAVLDSALPWGGASRIDVRLWGRGSDPLGVYWTFGNPDYPVQDNSFAVVRPRVDHEGDPRYVSDQGVELVCINGVGEIRWQVKANDATYPENREAVAHFGLTWSSR